MLSTGQRQHLLLAMLVTGTWCLATRNPPPRTEASVQEPTQDRSKTLEVDELVVKRLRVVENNGKDRVVIANASRFPKPRLGGKEYPRSISPAGMVFYRENGDECGGVAVVDTPQGTANMMILDYANNDALGFGVREAPGGTYSAGMTINDRPPQDAAPEKAASMAQARVSVENAAGRARIVLCDPQGRERILLEVDERGVPSIRVLGEDGKPVFQTP